ncbi:DNA-binding NarL/FixJ family response regulator [Duganella sp. 1224]|uniref:response regulator transcription factor n=1 Tax=Duganella sp. 1224 TaxID=2587052 RepID=UPI0018176331|nr:DNA-binding response regulator [Duganella sp. 1224]NYE59651.1 DNA-binding NarL/FixJ family response regulator [Duganella sp. 1224]
MRTNPATVHIMHPDHAIASRLHAALADSAVTTHTSQPHAAHVAGIVIADYATGVALARELHPAAIIVMTSLDREGDVRAAFDCGVRGYLLLSAGGQDIVAAVDTVARGQRYSSPQVSAMAAAPITVLTVDAHPIFREGVAIALDAMPDVRLVGQAGTGAEGIELHRRLRPDITLMDLQLPDQHGSEVIAAIRREAPGARVIVLTTCEGDFHASRAIRAGALGYMLKSAVRHELEETILSVHSGRRRILPAVACALAETMYMEKLSQREIEVLRLAAVGNTNQKIGDRLGLSEGTIKTHMKNAMAKMQAKDRTHAVLLAMQRGIINMGAGGRLPSGMRS